MAVSEPSSIPADVVWARGVRIHLQALYASAGIIALLTVLGVAAVSLAGPLANDPPVTVGVIALLIGGACALAGAVIAGVGQIKVLGAAREQASEPLPIVEGILAGTSRAFALLPRLAIAGCVVLIATALIWIPGGFWGALVGTFVVVQVALVLIAIRRFVLSRERLVRTA